jgi:hypothetical protein
MNGCHPTSLTLTIKKNPGSHGLAFGWDFPSENSWHHLSFDGDSRTLSMIPKD